MDISLLFDNATNSGVFQLSGGDLKKDTDLRTSILISLFSDSRALDSDEIPDQSNDKRGWCGDVFSDVTIGSRLWLLDRSYLTNDIALRAKDYIKEALQWMIDKKVVSSVVVDVQRYKNMGLKASISFTRNKKQTRYELVWNQELKHGQ